MCGGICGPTESTGYDYRSASFDNKPVKQRKVPYNDYRGTVIASYKTNRTSVELYKCKEGNNFTVSWRGSLSSGAATYTKKSNAIREYNGKVPERYKIRK